MKNLKVVRIYPLTLVIMKYYLWNQTDLGLSPGYIALHVLVALRFHPQLV